MGGGAIAPPHRAACGTLEAFGKLKGDEPAQGRRVGLIIACEAETHIAGRHGRIFVEQVES